MTLRNSPRQFGESDRLLRAMPKRHTAILLILTFLSVSNLFGQNKLRENIVSDSIIRNIKIKQVTENWFHDSLKTSPANTAIEKYNEFGQKTQRILINYFYYKFIENYEYNQKKNVIIKTQHYYDWDPYREKRKGDTIVKKTITKYDFYSGRKIKTKPSPLEEFQPRLSFDSNNRITERIDTIKFGYNITYYTYDKNNKVIERKRYTSRHAKHPYLFAVDSLHYNLNGQLVRETNYYDLKITEDKWVFDREVITTYNYYQNGLIQEKTSVTKYQSLNNRDCKPTVYRYEYEYY
jgi:hypothetical protein